MNFYDYALIIVIVVSLLVMCVSWEAVRLAVRWRHQREDYRAVIRNLHKQGHPHTHSWMQVGFIDDHAIEECWICHVEKPYVEAESEH